MQCDEITVTDSTKGGCVDTSLCCQKIPGEFPHAVAPRPYRTRLGPHGHQASSRLTDQRDAWNLTKRETEILQRLTTGLSNKKIAHELGLDPNYFNNALAKIYRKMKVRTRAQAMLKVFAADF